MGLRWCRQKGMGDGWHRRGTTRHYPFHRGTTRHHLGTTLTVAGGRKLTDWEGTRCGDAVRRVILPIHSTKTVQEFLANLERVFVEAWASTPRAEASPELRPQLGEEKPAFCRSSQPTSPAPRPTG